MPQQHISYQEQEELPRETWQTVPDYPRLTGSTIPDISRRLYIHSPTTILKLAHADDGEGIITALARSLLGSCVPRVISLVTVSSRNRDGMIITRQPGTPIVELWSSLTSSSARPLKQTYVDFLRQPYVFIELDGAKKHAYCTSRTEWDNSRVRALQNSSTSDAKLVSTLGSVQRSISGPNGWDRPVLTHGDLSSRNILVHPHTLEVTGFLDWEMANIMPAYQEYVMARLSGGHDSEWRSEVLDVLRSVLRHECVTGLQKNPTLAKLSVGEKNYKRALKAWNAMTNVERIAQEYNDDCFWTFETGLPET